MGKFSEFMQHPHLPNSGSQVDPQPADDSVADTLSEQDGILAQEPSMSKPEVAPEPGLRARRYLPATARIGFLGVVAVIMWWTWSRSDSPGLTLASQPELDQRITSPASSPSFAVINPANVLAEAQTASAAQPATIPSPTAWVDTIVVVTPTVSSVDAQAAPDRARADVAVEPFSTQEQPPAVPMLGDGANVDDTALTAMLAPLLETQVAATPLVIELEIPAPGPVSDRKVLPALALHPSTGNSNGLLPEIVLLPTATATPDPVKLAAVPAALPKVQIVPAVGVKLTPTPTSLPPTPAPTEAPNNIYPGFGPGRLWSTFAPLPPEQSDHFWVGDPFADASPNSHASPNYQFGSTAGNRYRPHHGLDISNPLGTPVQAAVEGEVIHAGPDDIALLGPYNNFYGNAVVIKLDRKLPVAGGQMDVFVLYGHLHEVYATVGQHVGPSDIIGIVGMTGIAIGPHLHIEVRLGANTYAHNVNPYLWMKPTDGNGAVAVRLLTSDNRTWAGAKISIARFEGGKAVWARQIETYLNTENIGPDPAWGDNGAMGDVPAGYYYLIGNVKGESVRAEFTVNPGQTTFVEIRTKQ